IEGESLENAIARGPIPIARGLEIAEQIGRALAHVHAAGILHRDVKPGNVMIRAADGGAVLTDFGLARDESEERRPTPSRAGLGTPAYMAPEQAEGRKDMDRRVDVYALGAVLYELLAGEPPFAGLPAFEVWRMIIEEPPEPPSRKRPEIPRDVEAI